MPDLNFRVEKAEVQTYAVSPLLLFRLHLTQAGAPVPIHSVVLRCQVRLEPARRRYHGAEQERLLDLFGTSDRWGQTVRDMLWTHTSVMVPPFSGEIEVALPVPCSYDFNLAVTKYFCALEGGEV